MESPPGWVVGLPPGLWEIRVCECVVLGVWVGRLGGWLPVLGVSVGLWFRVLVWVLGEIEVGVIGG